MKWIFLLLALFIPELAFGQAYNAMTYTSGSFFKGCGGTSGVCSADLLLLPTQQSGTQTYCKDCHQDALCSPGGTGALAMVINGVWTCGFGGGGGGGTACDTGSFNSVGTINFLAGPGKISITGNSGNGTDTINNVCVNGVNGTTCPVTAFGAKCDGVTDDTAAFVAAYTAMMAKGGGELDIPGVCVVNQVQLGGSVSGNLWIKGITANATLLKNPASITSPGSLLWSNGTGLKSLVIKNVTFDCNNVKSTQGFQNCVGSFAHAGNFEFDDNVVQNWDGYSGVWNLYQTTSATYLNNTFLNMQVSNTTNQYSANGVMDISSQSANTLAQGNKCLTGGKCVFIDEWPLYTDAHVNIIGNVSRAVTGYAVGNSNYRADGVDNVYGVIADNTEEGTGNFDSGIIVGGDLTSNPIGQTYVAVNNNVITGITGANSVGIQFNWCAYASAMGNVIGGGPNANTGSYAYYCNICQYCNFYGGTASGFLSIVGAVGSGFGVNARGTSSFVSGSGYGNGLPVDPGQVFLNGPLFQGTQESLNAPITLSGTATSGTAVCSQSQQGTLKMASCLLTNYINTGAAQVFYFPTAFNTVPLLLQGGPMGNTCGGISPSVGPTYMNLPAGAGMTAETCTITAMGQ